MYAVNHNAILMPLFFLSGFLIGQFLPEEPQSSACCGGNSGPGVHGQQTVALLQRVGPINDCLGNPNKAADYIATASENIITVGNEYYGGNSIKSSH